MRYRKHLKHLETMKFPWRKPGTTTPLKMTAWGATIFWEFFHIGVCRRATTDRYMQSTGVSRECLEKMRGRWLLVSRKKKSISAAGADRRDISCTVNRENHQAMNCSPFLIIQRGPHEQGSSLTSFHDVVFDEWNLCKAFLGNSVFVKIPARIFHSWMNVSGHIYAVFPRLTV